MDHQAAYVFAPESNRPVKRRRVELDGLQSSWPIRERTFQKLWTDQRARIDEVVKDANKNTQDRVVQFLNDILNSGSDGSLPCGFILGDLDSTVHSSFFQQLDTTLGGLEGRLHVQLKASECPNLKALLKSLIQKAISAKDSLEDELTNGISTGNGRKLLDYDLEVLQDWVRKTRTTQVIVTFQNSEAFDGHALAEAIELFSLSLPQVPFALLFGVATSIENLQDKLPRASLRLINGQQFDVVQSDAVLENVFHQTTADPTTTLRLGPQLSRLLLDRSCDQIAGVEDFSDALQYAYMTHFFANPLSVFLCDNLSFTDVSSEHFDALRNLPSFRQLVEKSVKEGKDLDLVKSWLDSNYALFQCVKSKMITAQITISHIVRAVDVLAMCHSVILKASRGARSFFYIEALQNGLRDSSAVREVLLAIKRAPSDQLAELLPAIAGVIGYADVQELGSVQLKLQNLLNSTKSRAPLRSEHDVRNETMRTTVIAHKVELSRHKENLSKSDAAYSEILTIFHNWLQSFFDALFVQLDSVFLNELCIYDQRGAHRAVFTPKTRFAIERALSSPFDYLGCSCCAPDEENHNGDISLKASHPATANLYLLYLESGPLINVSDLWSAFSSIMEDEEKDGKETMAVFEHSLAELRHLGLIKSTRKRTDHITKVAWKGL